jgi:hypothetical protein
MTTLLTFRTLFQMAWKYESTAFLLFLSNTIRSLLGVFDACTAFHHSCIVLSCAAANSIIRSMLPVLPGLAPMSSCWSWIPAFFFSWYRLALLIPECL